MPDALQQQPDRDADDQQQQESEVAASQPADTAGQCCVCKDPAQRQYQHDQERGAAQVDDHSETCKCAREHHGIAQVPPGNPRYHRALRGTVIRERRLGPSIQQFPKTEADRRVIALPPQTVALLTRRLATVPNNADPPVIFPSPQGRPRDPNNTSGDLRQALDRAGYPWVTSHTFRRTVATHLDDAGLSARQIADHLGHSRPSLTQDVYLGRGSANPHAAAALQRSL